ncbi:MAG: transposase, partial [Clostridia bacterium]|nr:transposase [Clostridia bacterium]MBR3295302.1 transposase [Clostridia bacterium]
ECEYNNGFTEGTNNSIKVIKRTAFGYRTFENLRKRILMVHTA